MVDQTKRTERTLSEILKKDETIIPGYRLVEELGRGAYGVVWKCTKPGISKDHVALKFVELNTGGGWQEFRGINAVIEGVKARRGDGRLEGHLAELYGRWLLDRFGNVIDDSKFDHLTSSITESLSSTVRVESRAATPVEHRNATDTVPHGSSHVSASVEGTPEARYLVIAQQLGDTTLARELTARSPGDGPMAKSSDGLPKRDVLEYIGQAAQAIDALNAAKSETGRACVPIYHCDIKPANLLLREKQLLLCDYGVARALKSNKNRTGREIGTPAYMSPECRAGEPGQHSDQFSLAITYYELRTNQLPYPADATIEDVYSLVDRQSLDFSHVSWLERRILRRATRKDPRRRYRSATHMVDALAYAAFPHRWLVRREAIAASLVAIFLVFAFLLWWLPRNRPTEAEAILLTTLNSAHTSTDLAAGVQHFETAYRHAESLDDEAKQTEWIDQVVSAWRTYLEGAQRASESRVAWMEAVKQFCRVTSFHPDAQRLRQQAIQKEFAALTAAPPSAIPSQVDSYLQWFEAINADPDVAWKYRAQLWKLKHRNWSFDSRNEEDAIQAQIAEQLTNSEPKVVTEDQAEVTMLQLAYIVHQPNQPQIQSVAPLAVALGQYLVEGSTNSAEEASQNITKLPLWQQEIWNQIAERYFRERDKLPPIQADFFRRHAEQSLVVKDAFRAIREFVVADSSKKGREQIEAAVGDAEEALARVSNKTLQSTLRTEMSLHQFMIAMADSTLDWSVVGERARALKAIPNIRDAAWHDETIAVLAQLIDERFRASFILADAGPQEISAICSLGENLAHFNLQTALSHACLLEAELRHAGRPLELRSDSPPNSNVRVNRERLDSVQKAWSAGMTQQSQGQPSAATPSSIPSGPQAQPKLIRVGDVAYLGYVLAFAAEQGVDGNRGDAARYAGLVADLDSPAQHISEQRREFLADLLRPTIMLVARPDFVTDQPSPEQYDLAETALNRITRLFPNDPSPWTRLVRTQLALRDPTIPVPAQVQQAIDTALSDSSLPLEVRPYWNYLRIQAGLSNTASLTDAQRTSVLTSYVELCEHLLKAVVSDDDSSQRDERVFSQLLRVAEAKFLDRDSIPFDTFLHDHGRSYITAYIQNKASESAPDSALRARLLSMMAVLAMRNDTIAFDLGAHRDASTFRWLAESMLASPANLGYLTEGANAYLRWRPQDDRQVVDDVVALSQKAMQLNRNSAATNNLSGLASLLQSRLTIDRGERRKFLDRAIDSFGKAITISSKRDRSFSFYCANRSTAYVEFAFLLPKSTEAERKAAAKYLHLARSDAQQAIATLPSSARSVDLIHAHIALGNASEDLGFYIRDPQFFSDPNVPSDHPMARTEPLAFAIENFQLAYRDAKTRRRRDQQVMSATCLARANVRMVIRDANLPSNPAKLGEHKAYLATGRDALQEAAPFVGALDKEQIKVEYYYWSGILASHEAQINKSTDAMQLAEDHLSTAVRLAKQENIREFPGYAVELARLQLGLNKPAEALSQIEEALRHASYGRIEDAFEMIAVGLQALHLAKGSQEKTALKNSFEWTASILANDDLNPDVRLLLSVQRVWDASWLHMDEPAQEWSKKITNDDLEAIKQLIQPDQSDFIRSHVLATQATYAKVIENDAGRAIQLLLESRRAWNRQGTEDSSRRPLPPGQLAREFEIKLQLLLWLTDLVDQGASVPKLSKEQTQDLLESVRNELRQLLKHPGLPKAQRSQLENLLN